MHDSQDSEVRRQPTLWTEEMNTGSDLLVQLYFIHILKQKTGLMLKTNTDVINLSETAQLLNMYLPIFKTGNSKAF